MKTIKEALAQLRANFDGDVYVLSIQTDGAAALCVVIPPGSKSDGSDDMLNADGTQVDLTWSKVERPMLIRIERDTPADAITREYHGSGAVN